MKFYHGTSLESWGKIQKEGVLWGIRNAPSRCTYLASAREEAKQDEVMLEVDYDPTEGCWCNNWFSEEWQHREYEPIPLSKISEVMINGRKTNKKNR